MVEDLGQETVLVLDRRFDLVAEDLRVVQILDADAAPGDLVLVGRPDAAFGGPNLLVAQKSFAHRVELAVVGHDEMGVAGDAQPGRIDTSLGQSPHLFEQHRGIYDTAVADYRGDLGVHHPAGNEAERERLFADDDGVAGVVAALVTDYNVRVLRQQIGDLALSFVAPLGADDDRGRHVWSFRCPGGW